MILALRFPGGLTAQCAGISLSPSPLPVLHLPLRPGTHTARRRRRRCQAEYDPLRTEGELYAKRLADAGSLVRATTHPGVMHDFYLRFHYQCCDPFWVELGQDIRKIMGAA